MIKEFENRMNNIIKYYPEANEILKMIRDKGETLLLGGALREFRDNKLKQMPRDFDIVVDTDNKTLDSILSPYSPEKNRFGGYKFNYENLVIDIWCLKNTWAFKEGFIKCSPNEYSKRLQDTVFLNIDAIVYNLSLDIWYDEKYIEAMKTRLLDVVLKDNPQILLNIIRALVLKKKYVMDLSAALKEIIYNNIINCKDYLNKLMQIQYTHYKHIIIEKNEIENEINNIQIY